MKKWGWVEELEPDNRMIREYQHMRGWAIIELRRLRAGAEWELRHARLTKAERKSLGGSSSRVYFPMAPPAAWIGGLSKNEAFSAFVGAFAAFMLVVLTDWRRQRPKVRKSLPGRIASVRLFASEARHFLSEVLAAAPADPIVPLRVRLPVPG